MSKLHQEAAVIRMASELGVDWRDPINAVISFCKKKIQVWVREGGGVTTIRQLETLVCHKLRLVFEEILEDVDDTWYGTSGREIVRQFLKVGKTQITMRTRIVPLSGSLIKVPGV